tara:strand:- start:22818 stop:23705 length:888 start_codon:yes stop_codon:yes gene_type:complete
MNDLHPNPILGIIGGSGMYDIAGLDNTKWHQINSPFGDTSDHLLFGNIDGQRIVFLPRHGRGHHLSPSDINYRANIDALKRTGVTDILSLSAVGSFREDLHPGTFVIVAQFIDRTFARQKSFFGEGMVAHVSMANPVNERLGDWCEDACKKEKIPMMRGGTYLAMEGPQFSTKAESNMYRSWGCDVIGMTNMPEAKLAREAEIPYCTIAMVTDYDCWHPHFGAVNVENIGQVLRENAEKGKALIKCIAKKMQGRPTICPSGDDNALENALITAKDARHPELLQKLDAITGRVLNK